MEGYSTSTLQKCSLRLINLPLACDCADSNCFPWLEGKPCEIEAWNQVCEAQGYPNPDARCGHPPPGKGGGNGDYCCCYAQ